MKVWELVEKLAKLGMDNEVYIYPKMEGPLTVPQVHLAGDSNKQVVVVSMTGDLEPWTGLSAVMGYYAKHGECTCRSLYDHASWCPVKLGHLYADPESVKPVENPEPAADPESADDDDRIRITMIW